MSQGNAICLTVLMFFIKDDRIVPQHSKSVKKMLWREYTWDGWKIIRITSWSEMVRRHECQLKFVMMLSKSWYLKNLPRLVLRNFNFELNFNLHLRHVQPNYWKCCKYLSRWQLFTFYAPEDFISFAAEILEVLWWPLLMRYGILLETLIKKKKKKKTLYFPVFPLHP